MAKEYNDVERGSFAEFKERYKAAILAHIEEEKKRGTTGLGSPTLFQAVKVPDGGPTGTNATWALQMMFREIVKGTPAIKSFIVR